MISGLAKFSGGGLENVVSELNSFLINCDVTINIFGRSSHDFVDFSRNCKIIGVRSYFLFFGYYTK